uniref:Amidase domain-containing protein n=1 Tax=Romanomermis culicivorax TaxID=13658 RepID=A0A915JHY0_ROMCU
MYRRRHFDMIKIEKDWYGDQDSLNEKLSILGSKILAKRNSRDRTVAEVEKILADEKYDGKIVDLTFAELKRKLQNDELTPYEVLLAYLDRALTAHSTGGLTQFINKPAAQDCNLVQKFKSAGAVPFLRTNVPTTGMSIGSCNPIYGATRNPFDPERSPGGSTSGEAALIALHGSPLGVGSDIGGSVRTPAHWSGICSLKPTTDRFTLKGHPCSMRNLFMIPGAGGLLSRDVEGLVEGFRMFWTGESCDNQNVPMPFNENLYTSNEKLTIGYYEYDGYIEAAPACRCVVRMAVEILKSKGHRMVPFSVPDVSRMMQIYKGLLYPDNMQHHLETIDREFCEKTHFQGWFNDPLVDHSKIKFAKVESKNDYFNLCDQFLAYRENFARVLKSAGIDCLICPVSAFTAPPLDQPPLLHCWGWNYCALYNFLDYPAGVVPMNLVNEGDEAELAQFGLGDGVTE